MLLRALGGASRIPAFAIPLGYSTLVGGGAFA